ncbi:methyltransferase domain-containing protein [Tirmania nivea]|nr:methyltransferase domain-containing protein [Tirmania nivea]
MLRIPTMSRDGLWLFIIILLSLYTLHLHRSNAAPDLYGNSIHSGRTPWTLDDRLKLSEEIYTETLIRRFAAVDAKTYKVTPYSIWDLIPAAFNCPWDIQRVGHLGDGGKWVCGLVKYLSTPSKKDIQARPCVIYSFGVRDESSFEEEMLQRTACGVWGYDPAVSKWGPQLSAKYVEQGRAKFLRAALGPTTEKKGDTSFYTLKKLMEMNGHTYIDFLKLDIEYAEFDSITAFLNDFAGQELPFGQLLIELHVFKDRITARDFLSWWEALEQRGLRPVWTEPNLIYVTQHLSDSMPRLAEYTLININSSVNPLLYP